MPPRIPLWCCSSVCLYVRVIFPRIQLLLPSHPPHATPCDAPWSRTRTARDGQEEGDGDGKAATSVTSRCAEPDPCPPCAVVHVLRGCVGPLCCCCVLFNTRITIARLASCRPMFCLSHSCASNVHSSLRSTHETWHHTHTHTQVSNEALSLVAILS